MMKCRVVVVIVFVWGYFGLLVFLFFMNWFLDVFICVIGECKKSDCYYYMFVIIVGFFLFLIIFVINYFMVFKVVFM